MSIPSTGTLTVRGVLPNADRALLPGMFVRIRVPLALEQAEALLVPDMALGADQAGRYLLVVDKDNVVQQRTVTTGQLVGKLRVIDTGICRRRPGGGHAASRRRSPARRWRRSRPAITADARRDARQVADDLEILHRTAGAGQCAGDRHRADRRGRAVRPAGGAVSERGAADGVGHHALSRRQRRDRDEHGGAADRAAGERRAGHAVHAVHQRDRRHLCADRHLRDRHRSEFRAGAGAEPRVGAPWPRCRRRCRCRA